MKTKKFKTRIIIIRQTTEAWIIVEEIKITEIEYNVIFNLIGVYV